MVICLERSADFHMAQLMPLPLTVSCFSKIQIGFTFLVPAHSGSPGQRAVKRVCVCAFCVLNFFLSFKEVPSPLSRVRCQVCRKAAASGWIGLSRSTCRATMRAARARGPATTSPRGRRIDRSTTPAAASRRSARATRQCISRPLLIFSFENRPTSLPIQMS